MRCSVIGLALLAFLGSPIVADDLEQKGESHAALTSQQADDQIKSTRVLSRKQTLAEPPKPIARPMPDYPISAIKKRRSGNVLVWFDVLGNGRTANIEVAYDEGEREFAEAALIAVGRWLYEPRVEDGVGVTRTGNYVELSFGIEKPGSKCNAPEPQYDKPGVEQIVVCASRVRR
jgi:TonB family protein